MATAIRPQRTLRATLCEVERGVFYTTYPDCASARETDALTSYQIGPSAADARHRIELRAHALGYDAVMWSETIVVPLFASTAPTTLDKSAATFVSPRQDRDTSQRH